MYLLKRTPFLPHSFNNYLLNSWYVPEYKAVKKKKKTEMAAAILEPNTILSIFGFWSMPCLSFLPL